MSTTTPPRDFVEVTEDLSSSPLWNPDLAPTPLERRTWSTYHIAALWIGMSVVITTYTLASGLMQQGMTWLQAMLTILLGNLVVLVPMILLVPAVLLWVGTRGRTYKEAQANVSVFMFVVALIPMVQLFMQRREPDWIARLRRVD